MGIPEKHRQELAANSSREQGFSLIELIVVITIIGILASVVVVNVTGQDDKARAAKALAEVNSISDAAQMFKLDQSIWPESIDELMNPPELPNGGQANPYLKKRPKDPWTGEDYIFEPDDRGVFVASYGADMEEGGEGVNADLTNREQNN